MASLLKGGATFTPLGKPEFEVRGSGTYTGLFSKSFSGGMASPMPASWNHLAIWLKQIDNLRQAA